MLVFDEKKEGICLETLCKQTDSTGKRLAAYCDRIKKILNKDAKEENNARL